MRPQVRPLSFADFELQAQGVALEATLQALADFLDAQAELVTLVHHDLVRGLRRPQTGRDGLSAARVLRAFVLQRVKAWDLSELRARIADGYTLRRFTTFEAALVPQHDAFPPRLLPPDPRDGPGAQRRGGRGRGRAWAGGRHRPPRRHHRGGDRHPFPHGLHAPLGCGPGPHAAGEAPGRARAERPPGLC